MIQSPEIASENKLRLTILYALRYQKYSQNAINQTIELLMNNGVSESDAALVHVILNFAGADQRQDDLFMNENFFSRGKSAMKGLKVNYRNLSSFVVLVLEPSAYYLSAGGGERLYTTYASSPSNGRAAPSRSAARYKLPIPRPTASGHPATSSTRYYPLHDRRDDIRRSQNSRSAEPAFR
jgi:hypothetical protein